MKFYLGTHLPSWLDRTLARLFLSRRTLCRQKTWRRALAPWALDSGGFSELSMYGEWTVSAEDYVQEVRTWQEEIGMLDWAAIQDHMCEPVILEKTGKTVRQHQDLTILSLLTLQDLAPDLPWTPVLQGWEPEDYLRHRDLYEQAGVDLADYTPVGIGSVCRRQNTTEVEDVIRRLHSDGLRIHGFGFKVQGVRRVGDALYSADSLAWSYGARREPRLEGCTSHKNCANCMKYALRWRRKVVRDFPKTN